VARGGAEHIGELSTFYAEIVDVEMSNNALWRGKVPAK
jgi:hypothetical protein